VGKKKISKYELANYTSETRVRVGNLCFMVNEQRSPSYVYCWAPLVYIAGVSCRIYGRLDRNTTDCSPLVKSSSSPKCLMRIQNAKYVRARESQKLSDPHLCSWISSRDWHLSKPYCSLNAYSPPRGVAQTESRRSIGWMLRANIPWNGYKCLAHVAYWDRILLDIRSTWTHSFEQNVQAGRPKTCLH
jgi:hypothetical protein